MYMWISRGLTLYFHVVSTSASSRHTNAGAPLTDPRVMQLTRPDPRQKQGTLPTTPLTQVHLQPDPLHFMQQQQPQQSQLAGRFPMPPTGVLPHETSQLSFFGSRDSQPPPLMSPVAMVCYSILDLYSINHFNFYIDSLHVVTSPLG